MRYRFIDRVVELQLAGRPRVEALKAFPGGEATSGPLGSSRVPNALVLELLATTGGYLVFQLLGARRLPILLKATDVHFERHAAPGVVLRTVATVSGQSAVAESLVTAEAAAEVYDGAARVACGRFFYGCVPVAGVDLQAFAAVLQEPA